MNEPLCVLPLAMCGFSVCAFVAFIAWVFSMSEEERRIVDPRNKPVNPWDKRL